MHFTVDRDRGPSQTVLSVHGELDIATVTVLREQVAAVLRTSPPKLVIDLSGTGFIDSTGCGELARAAKAGAAAGVPVELVVPPRNAAVRRVVDFMQLESLVPVHAETPRV